MSNYQGTVDTLPPSNTIARWEERLLTVVDEPNTWHKFGPYANSSTVYTMKKNNQEFMDNFDGTFHITNRPNEDDAEKIDIYIKYNPHSGSDEDTDNDE